LEESTQHPSVQPQEPSYQASQRTEDFAPPQKRARHNPAPVAAAGRMTSVAVDQARAPQAPPLDLQPLPPEETFTDASGHVYRIIQPQYVLLGDRQHRHRWPNKLLKEIAQDFLKKRKGKKESWYADAEEEFKRRWKLECKMPLTSLRFLVKCTDHTNNRVQPDTTELTYRHAGSKSADYKIAKLPLALHKLFGQTRKAETLEEKMKKYRTELKKRRKSVSQTQAKLVKQLEQLLDYCDVHIQLAAEGRAPAECVERMAFPKRLDDLWKQIEGCKPTEQDPLPLQDPPTDDPDPPGDDHSTDASMASFLLDVFGEDPP
jgi:hypothetical protein